jgi:predicted phage-related endonuclease
MPDPLLKTISATQSAALFDVSPYITRWLLWRVFSGIDEIEMLDADDNERMFWGTALEPIIFVETLRRLNLEGEYNTEQDYFRNEELRLGCTPDGRVWHPSKGVAIVQVKCVDWFIWKDQWVDDVPPPHIVHQVQHEMLAIGATWAVIPCLIGGNELRLYELEADEEYQAEILKRVGEFFASVESKEEPDPLGDPMEVPALLKREYKPKEVADLRENEEAFDAIQALNYWTPRMSAGKKAVDKAKAKLLALSGGAGIIKAHGYGCEIKQSPTKEGVQELPPELREKLEVVAQEHGSVAAAEAATWRKVTRKAGITRTYKTWEEATDGAPAWVTGFDPEIMGA